MVETFVFDCDLSQRQKWLNVLTDAKPIHIDVGSEIMCMIQSRPHGKFVFPVAYCK